MDELGIFGNPSDIPRSSTTNVLGSTIPMAMGAGFFNNLRRGTSKPLLNLLYGEALKDPSLLTPATAKQLKEGVVQIGGRVPTFKNVQGLSKQVSRGPIRIGAGVKGPGDYLKLMGKVPRVRGVAGLTGLFALLDAAQELRDPTDPVAVNVAEAGGKIGGTIGGAALGGILGQALIPIPGVGWVIGSTAGGMLGGNAGKGLARGVYSVFDPNVDLNQAKKKARIQNEINKIGLEPTKELLREQNALARQSQQDAILANAMMNANAVGGQTVNSLIGF